VEEARRMLETAYAWLDVHMATREWATGTDFTMADCGAAPFLFYADWTHPIDERFAHVRAYRARLLARPSVKRAVDEARPFRSYFPLGAPDRD
jgi:glutathione S-transferase